VQSDGQMTTFWKYNLVHHFANYHPGIHEIPLKMYVKTYIEKREELAMGMALEATLKYREDNIISNGDNIQEFLSTRKRDGSSFSQPLLKRHILNPEKKLVWFSEL
jgi:hypothetical protein